MDVREKLVELLEPHVSGLACEYESGSCELTSCRSCNARNIADHLISHGVTVQELDGCEHCRTASYTEKPFVVITQMGREVKTQFNFCPNCGRRLQQPPKGE